MAMTSDSTAVSPCYDSEADEWREVLSYFCNDCQSPRKERKTEFKVAARQLQRDVRRSASCSALMSLVV